MNFYVTDSFTRVVSTARKVAQEDSRDAARPRDLLAALIIEGDRSLGGHLLRRACLKPELLDRELDNHRLSADVAPSAEAFTSSGGETLQRAMEVAHDLGTTYVDSEHLLLSLLGCHGDSETQEWFALAGVTEVTVLRRWIALMLRDSFGTSGLSTEP